MVQTTKNTNKISKRVPALTHRDDIDKDDVATNDVNDAKDGKQSKYKKKTEETLKMHHEILRSAQQKRKTIKKKN